jgi:hypothetical protein
VNPDRLADIAKRIDVYQSNATDARDLLAHARTLQRRLDIVGTFLLVHARDCPHKPRSDCFGCLARALLETIAGTT